MKEITDKQLLKRFAGGSDERAFGLLVDRYVNVAYAAAISYLGSEDLARDACQLTFVQLSKKAGKLSEKVQLGGWIHATARNMARNIQKTEARRHKREERYADELMQKTTTETDWAQLGPELHEALEHLKPADRDAVILRFFQGKNLAEVGEALGVTADAARMRLNRALDHMGDRLAKKGVTSTATALAAALPAHAALAAPTGLASTISTAVLTGAGVSTTATLTGVIITTMKAKIIIISAALAATTLVGTSVYLANKTDSVDANHSTAPAALAAEQESTTDAVPRLANTTSPSDAPSSAPAAEPTPTETTGTALDSKAKTVALNINPEYLRKAEQTVALLEMAFPLMNNDMIKTTMADQIENPSEKLQIRLGLDPETAEKFNAVLTEHTESEGQRLKELTTGMMDSMKQMLENDREAAVDYMALESMREAGETLSPEQLAYVQYWEGKMKQSFGLEDGEDAELAEPKQWYEEETVLGDLNDLLTEQQQDELELHIMEKEKRAQERHAYDRSSTLANELGLNELDRSALYDYLYENPGASNDDISEQLAPELRALMPQDSEVGAKHSFSISTETKTNL